MAYTYVDVVGAFRYRPDGLPLTGSITFTPPAGIRDSNNVSLTARTFTLVDGSIPVAASNAERLARLDDPGTVNPSEPYYTVTHTLPADIVPGTIAVTTSHSVIDLSSSVSRPNFSIVSLTQAEMDSIAGNLVPHVLYVVNG